MTQPVVQCCGARKALHVVLHVLTPALSPGGESRADSGLPHCDGLYCLPCIGWMTGSRASVQLHHDWGLF